MVLICEQFRPFHTWMLCAKIAWLIGFLCHFKVKFNVEKYAAIQSFKLHKFEKEWDVLKNILEWFYIIIIIFIIFIIYFLFPYKLGFSYFCYIIILVEASNLVI